MQRSRRVHSAALACLLAIGFAPAALAAGQSGCVTCHLDKSMIIKNLGAETAKKSAMQSGAG
jgi:hypothetical protein